MFFFFVRPRRLILSTSHTPSSSLALFLPPPLETHHHHPPKTIATFQVAIERALSDPAAKSNRIDTALANVGALFAKRVSGAVSTEVDPRVARDADAIVARAKALLALYEERGVKGDKVLIRIPATWEGIEAAKRLEAEGKKTHVILVSSFAQAAAAAQAGVSVVQPNIGALADWYRSHPNFPRNPKGPREDSGFSDADYNPGIELAKRIWLYNKKYFPATKTMVSGIRSRDDALALAGVDFLVAGPKVLEALREMPTRVGYNDGLSAASAPADDVVPLTAEAAAAATFDDAETATLTKQLFEEGLGTVGRDLLEQGLKKLCADVDRLSSFDSMVQGHE